VIEVIENLAVGVVCIGLPIAGITAIAVISAAALDRKINTPLPSNLLEDSRPIVKMYSQQTREYFGFDKDEKDDPLVLFQLYKLKQKLDDFRIALHPHKFLLMDFGFSDPREPYAHHEDMCELIRLFLISEEGLKLEHGERVFLDEQMMAYQGLQAFGIEKAKLQYLENRARQGDLIAFEQWKTFKQKFGDTP